MCNEVGHLNEQQINKLSSVLQRVREQLKENQDLTRDIDDVLDIFTVNAKDNIIIPNTSYRKKIFKRYEIQPETNIMMKRDKIRMQQTNALSYISIALNFNSKSEAETRLLIQEIVPAIASQSNYKFLIATQYESVKDAASSATVDWVHTSNTWTEGQVWNQLVRRVQTPFVLIGRDMAMYTSQVNLVRFLKVMSVTGSPIIGGSTKTVEDGHWSLNCLQMLHYNYSIFYQSGYHKSEESCLYCDFIWGPFVAEKQFLISNRFSETLPSNLVFQDFFFRVNSQLEYTSAVCPDSIFDVSYSSPQFPIKSEWLLFAKQHSINRIKLPKGNSVSFTCEELGQSAPVHEAGKMKAPCDLQILSELLKLFFATCEEIGIYCELGFSNLFGMSSKHFCNLSCEIGLFQSFVSR